MIRRPPRSTLTDTRLPYTTHVLARAVEGGAIGILGHNLTVPASAYTPVYAALIPTGELKPVDGGVFDFRNGRIIGDGIRDGTDPQIVIGRGYDHNFALDAVLTAEPKLAAWPEDPASGHVLEMLSTEPGVARYTRQFIAGPRVGLNGPPSRQDDGLAVE